MVISLEPSCLAVIRALARHLEVEPLLGMVVVIRTRCVAELAIGVVLLNEVLNDCAGFPEGKVGVGVVDGRHAAVRVDFEVLGLFNILEAYRDDFVR